MHNPLSKEAREVVLGTILGDGCLFLGTSNRHYKLVVCHSPTQSEYFNWKLSHLKDVATKPQTIRAWHKRNQKEYSHIQVATTPMSYFTRLRKLFYLDGKKIVRRSVLNRLTPLGLATWFMDDGSTAKNNRNYPQLTIYTCSFSELDHKIMQEYFQEKWGIRVLIHGLGKQPRLYFNKPNAIKFIEIIKPHIIPSMMYKLRYFIENAPHTVDQTVGRYSLN